MVSQEVLETINRFDSLVESNKEVMTKNLALLETVLKSLSPRITYDRTYAWWFKIFFDNQPLFDWYFELDGKHTRTIEFTESDILERINTALFEYIESVKKENSEHMKYTFNTK